MRQSLTLLATLFLIVIAAGSAFAELDFEKKSFYAQGVLALPMGTLGDFAGTGFGGGAGMVVPFNEKMDFRAEVSYLKFGGEEFTVYGGDTWDYSYSQLPIMVLAQYQMKPEDPYYLLGGLGLTRTSVSIDYPEGSIFGSTSSDASSTDLSLSIGAGYNVAENINIEARYTLISDANSFTVHGVYDF